MNPICLVENLSLPTLVFYIFPHLLILSLKETITKRNVYYFDVTRVVLFMLKLLPSKLNVLFIKLDFKIAYIKDPKGKGFWWNITYFEVLKVHKKIIHDLTFVKSHNSQLAKLDKIIHDFLAKEVLTCNKHDPHCDLTRAIALVQLVHYNFRNEALPHKDCIFFMYKRLWQKYINDYAKEYGLSVVSLGRFTLNFKNISHFCFTPRIKLFLSGYFDFIKTIFHSAKNNSKKRNSEIQDTHLPQIGVEYNGYLNLDKPELFTELFFLNGSLLNAESIRLFFINSKDPLNEINSSEIKKHKVNAVAINYRFVSKNSGPVFTDKPRLYQLSTTEIPKLKCKFKKERTWAEARMWSFYFRKEFWKRLLKTYNITVYLSWYKYDSNNYVIAEALKELGGINIIYQRAFEQYPSQETAFSADIFFGFSKEGNQIEKLSGSRIKYYVITGYCGDYRFPLLKEYAQKIILQLKKNGAKKIIGFFDENSWGDPRWTPGAGHEFTRKNYEFILQKIIEEPWLGLVVKPKTPFSLRERLGPISDLLSEAQKTGRCFVFNGKKPHNAYPPAVAALCSDIVIHGHLCAATAGIESALAGTPTVMIDQEGLPDSVFYKFGNNSIVFRNWTALWSACEEHFKQGLKGFGDWSSYIDYFDPFRDGKAGERLGNYLNFLMNGYKKGLEKDIIMIEAAEYYAKKWGKDKVIFMN